jgi:hypothetical protein
MSLHIGDLTSQVTVEGSPPTLTPPASEAAQPTQSWDKVELHRRLTHEVRELRRRTSGEGFDG